MAKFKNIRMKKAGGGTRLQRVQVLKSGKFKFVKNRGKGTRGSTISTKVTRSRASSKSKGGVTTARRRRRAAKRARAKKNTTIPVALVLGGGTGTVITVKDTWNAWKNGGAKKAFRKVVLRMTGLDIEKRPGDTDFWRPMEAYFTLGWGTGQLVHWAVGKKMGVNKALGAAKVPWLRV